MRVKDCMSKEIVWATRDNTICDVVKLMNEHHIGCIPICDEKQSVIGIVTDRDIILRGIACDKNAKQTKINDIMTTDVIRTSKDTDVNWVVDIMAQNQIRRVPVVENEKLVGMITLGDLAKNDDVPNNKIEKCICHICDCSEKNSQ